MGEEIGDGIITPRDMSEGVVEFLEILNPACLLARDFVWLSEILEILMIGMYFDWVCSAKEERSSHFEAK